MNMPAGFYPLALVSVTALLGAGAAHAEGAEEETDSRTVIGLSAIHAPTYVGAEDRVTKVRPAVSFRAGRWLISSSRASDLGGLKATRDEPGASTVLRDTDHWQTGLAFRLNSGRQSADDPALTGIPDLPRSLEIRLSALRRLDRHWNVATTLVQDLAHPRQGARVGLSLGWAAPLAEGWRARAGVGLEAANGNYMRTHFGVTAAQALPGTRPAYDPGAGLLSASLSAGIQYTVTPNWLITASFGSNRLLGPAADSPLAQRRNSFATMLGVAWVSNRR
jgi:outer membrane scaffolding protein for murein synthesis (MipA/OmpV family)